MLNRLLLTIALGLCLAISSHAQTNLTGRIYYNKNIMDQEMAEVLKELDKKLPEVKAKAIEKEEKEKGRKLNTTETAEVEKKVKEAQELMVALKKGTSTGVTITFKDEKNLVMKIDMKMDEEVLKKAGVSWAKRKLLKAAMNMTPSEKATYKVKGNLVIIEDEKEPDTMRLSNDGKQLFGKLDKNTKFTLTRTK